MFLSPFQDRREAYLAVIRNLKVSGGCISIAPCAMKEKFSLAGNCVHVHELKYRFRLKHFSRHLFIRKLVLTAKCVKDAHISVTCSHYKEGFIVRQTRPPF